MGTCYIIKDDCTKYLECSNKNLIEKFDCDWGTLFDYEKMTCIYAPDAKCYNDDRDKYRLDGELL